jgi:hypothetical protein
MSGSVTISSSGVPARLRSMPALADEVLVQALARVFFQVRAHQSHGLFLVAEEEAHLAALHHRDLKLADLVALGQVGVEVVLAREHALLGDVRTQREAEADGVRHRFAVHHRQRARQRQVHRASLRVRLSTEGRGRAAEDLALGGQLGVRLEADHDFVALHQKGSLFLVAHVQKPSGVFRCQSVACWKACAVCSSSASLK